MTSARSAAFCFFCIAITMLSPVAAFAVTVNDPVERERIDREYRVCERAAVDEEIRERTDAEREYADDLRYALDRYRHAANDAWEMTDERARRDALREAKSDFTDRERDIKRTLSRRRSDAAKTANDARRTCKRAKTDAEKAARDREKNGGNTCYSDANCASGYQCTTTTGECRPGCQDPYAPYCVQVCTGICVKKSSSSRSSSSRSSSRSSLSMSSSRSSSAYCQPYRCYDGSEFPSCTQDGYPISYLLNPCHGHGGQRPY